MRFRLFEQRIEPHIRKSLEHLEEARLAWVEHQAAAEHHAALAGMYAERITRIEQEMNSQNQQPRSLPPRQPPEEIRDEVERVKPESVVVYPSRVTRS